MYKILTLNRISDKGLALLTDDYKLTDDINEADGILVRSFDMNEMEIPDNVKAISRAGAGVNNIPCAALKERGIPVFNTPGANANAVKELVLAAMIMACRNGIPAEKWAEGLSGADADKQAEKGKGQFVGHEIAGQTLGVIGLGAIGAKVSNAAAALGMKVIGYDAFLSDAAKANLDKSVEIAANEDEVLRAADILTIHIPATKDTKGSFNAEVFAKLKDGAIVLNFARNTLINEQDLLAAIEAGKIGQYYTDFLTENILNKPKVVCFPHLGASTEEAEENCAVMAVQELMDYLERGIERNRVNA